MSDKFDRPKEILTHHTLGASIINIEWTEKDKKSVFRQWKTISHSRDSSPQNADLGYAFAIVSGNTVLSR